MNPSTRSTGRTIRVAIRTMALFTVVLGVLYTVALTGLGQLAAPSAAQGSIVRDAAGAPVGSSLIGQSFVDAEGAPRPEYFQSRPSAAGEGYDAGASSGSNLGPENPDLVETIMVRRAEVAAFNGVPEAEVPADALTASASGLDPHISPAYAAIQVERVARERSLPAADVRGLVEQHTQGRTLGVLGEPIVDVLALNLALDEEKGS
jgi:potassium-transporting ATPase KdpC subunit